MKQRGTPINGPVLRALIAVKSQASPEGFTARDLARALSVSSATVTNWAKGARSVDPHHLDALVRVFGLEDSRALQLETIHEVEREVERQRARRNKGAAA
jgi:transcriptional regulator with XRE-family HTH domain